MNYKIQALDSLSLLASEWNHFRYWGSNYKETKGYMY